MLTLLSLLFFQCFLQLAVSQQCVDLPDAVNPANGDIVLGSSPSNASGVVHIYLHNTWGTLCYDNDSGTNVGNTICKQLGYSGAISSTLVPRKQSECPVVLSDVNCTSNSRHLLRCDFIESGSCDTVAFVICDTSEPTPDWGQLRLFNGSLASQGLLEVYINDRWGTVCGAGQFNDMAADVACRQLGYTNAREHGRYRWYNERVIWVRDPVCPSNSSCFTDCYNAPTIRSIDCSNSQDVFLSCTYDLNKDDFVLEIDDCVIRVIPVHPGIRIVLLLIFCAIVLLYLTCFIVRFLTAAWHKSERYKKNAAARRYDFKNTYTKTLSRNSISPDGIAVFNT